MSLTYLQAVAFDRSIAEAHIYFAWISTEYVLVVVFTYRCAEDFLTYTPNFLNENSLFTQQW